MLMQTLTYRWRALCSEGPVSSCKYGCLSSLMTFWGGWEGEGGGGGVVGGWCMPLVWMYSNTSPVWGGYDILNVSHPLYETLPMINTCRSSGWVHYLAELVNVCVSFLTWFIASWRLQVQRVVWWVPIGIRHIHCQAGHKQRCPWIRRNWLHRSRQCVSGGCEAFKLFITCILFHAHHGIFAHTGQM